MSSARASAKRRRMACGLAWAALSMLAACGATSDDADTDQIGDQRSVAPPAESMAMPMGEAMHGSLEQPAGAVDMPKPKPGGQSGSDSGGSFACATVTTMIAGDDMTPWGITLSELLAQASDPLSQQGAVALYWEVGDWKATALHLEVEADASGAQLVVPTADSGCAGDDRIAKQVTVHLHTDDGLLDQTVDAQLNVTGDERPYFVLQGSVLGDALAGSALEQALVERGGIDGFSAFNPFENVDFMLGYGPPSAEQVVGGGFELWLRDDESGTNTRLIELASVSGSDPVPSPRAKIAPPASLAGECTGLSATSALEPPNVAYEDRLAALKGAWILCGGDRPEPIALDFAGVVIADDGSFAHMVQNADGSLQQRLGFTHQGTIQINDANMGTLLIHAVVIRDMVLDTNAGLAGAGSRQIELSADRNTMRWVLSSEPNDSLELVFHRSELAVSAAPASSYSSGERGGAAACDGDERDVNDAKVTDWQDVIGGSWVWCSGGPSDAVGSTLELDALGTFRQLDPSGHATSSGSYAVLPGNPPEVHYLQLTPEGGTPWTMFAVLASLTPRKLLVVTDHNDGASRIGMLSAAP